MLIRALDPIGDHAGVLGFLHRAADYLRLERDADPSPQVAPDFFTDCPPGCDPAQSRGRGVGPRILRYLQNRAREMGMMAVCLSVLAANPRGRAFWEREGFRDTGLAGDVTLGQKVQLAHRLGKSLS